MDLPLPYGVIKSSQLAEKIKSNVERVIIIDSRSFLEYNTSHIIHAVNVCCSKLVKRRLQQDKVLVRDLLAQTCQVDTENNQEIVVYDQSSASTSNLSPDCFLVVLLKKLSNAFSSVRLLKGGFLEFQANHASLCESKSASTMSSAGYKCPPLTSMSQPCMPVANVGPTKILPFLYLGSQQDALSQEIMEKNGINYVLNISTTCPRPSFIAESHFLRVAVMDNYCDKLLPHFTEAFQFLDKVREASGCVLIHCLAGISRSATTAIAYMMHYQKISYDEAYKYIKDKRPTISPNFNFLGQLLEYEKLLKKERGEQENVSPPLTAAVKKHCAEGAKSPVTPKSARLKFLPFVFSSSHATTNPAVVQSPTTALSKLSFSAPSPVLEEPNTPSSASLTPTGGELPFPHLPPAAAATTTSTSLDRLSFIPCFAGSSEFTDQANKFQMGDVVMKTPMTGTKRPISSTLTLELGTSHHHHTQGTTQNADSTGTRVGMGSEEVKYRSSGFKAKKQLVRPNSIAFSSYPLFDKPVAVAEHNVAPAAAQSESSHNLGCCSMDCSSSIQSMSSGQLSSTVHHSQTFSSPPHNNTISNTQSNKSECVTPLQRCMVTSNSSHVVEMREKDPEQQAARAGTSSFEQSRKSRSLEDILSAADAEEQTAVGGCPSHVRARRQKRLINAAEMFSQSTAGTHESSLRCRGPLETHHHQSSSSISSSGSHSSLHGSLEIIQVS